MARLNIAVLPGDGIGPDVVRAALDVLRVISDACGHQVNAAEWPIGYVAMQGEGDALPASTLQACLEADAVLVGAVGDPRADAAPPAERPVAGLLKLRRELGCFANLRPVRVSEGLVQYSPLRADRVRGVDMMIVRELGGGLYYGEPRGLDVESGRGWNTLSYERWEVDRIARVAFGLARGRGGRVTSIDKANVIEVSRLWRTTVDAVAEEYPDITVDHMLVDRAAMEVLARPAQFDTILTENLFGDILSDEAGGLAGSLGLLGSASLGGTTDLYEPVHGSAPDIVDAGTANPTGTIASLALMLRHSFGLEPEATAIEQALDAVFAAGGRTADLGGGELASTASLGTRAFAAEVADRIHLEPGGLGRDEEIRLDEEKRA